MRAQNPDSVRLFALAAVLTAIGLAIVYSASGVVYEDRFGDHALLLRRQAMYACAGLLLLLGASSVPPEFWAKRRWWLIAVAFLALATVYVPGIGTDLGTTARRWVRVGSYTVQPSEFARIALILGLAAIIARNPNRLKSFSRGFVPVLGIVLCAAGLIGMGPDVGTAALTGAALGVVLFVGGARLSHLAVCGGAAVVLGGAFVATRFGHVMHRIEEWGTGYQIRQALVGIGAGGWFGAGPGQGTQKLLFLPEAPSDFIFSVWAEEFGFLGSVALVLLYAALLITGFRIARAQADPFRRIAAIGLTASVSIGALFNLMVATAMLPAKGTPLPFLSGGGSSLVATLLAIGLLMSLSGDRRQATGDSAEEDTKPERLEG